MGTHRSLIEREIRQKKPFASSAVIPLISLLRTASVVERRYNAILQPYGITFQQFNVLSILRGAEPEGHPTLEIGARLIATTPGVTRLVQKLVAKGLVRRQPGTMDRRQVICRISLTGLILLGEVDPVLLATDELIIEPLDEPERGLLVDLLDRLRAPLSSTVHPDSEEIPA